MITQSNRDRKSRKRGLPAAESNSQMETVMKHVGAILKIEWKNFFK